MPLRSWRTTLLTICTVLCIYLYTVWFWEDFSFYQNRHISKLQGVIKSWYKDINEKKVKQVKKEKYPSVQPSINKIWCQQTYLQYSFLSQSTIRPTTEHFLEKAFGNYFSYFHYYRNRQQFKEKHRFCSFRFLRSYSAFRSNFSASCFHRCDLNELNWKHHIFNIFYNYIWKSGKGL